MPLRPTVWTAAAAGAVAAIAWPWLWGRFGDAAASGGGVGLVVGSLLAIALPAHLLVIGFAQPPRAAPGTLDTALLVRIGAWTAAAIATTLVAGASGVSGTSLV